MSHRGLSIVLAVAAALVSCAARAADEPLDYFTNSWNVIGLRDYQDGARLTPDNRLLVADGEVRFFYGGNLTPLSRKQVKTLLEGWLPVVLVTAADGAIRYEFTFWATPLPKLEERQIGVRGATSSAAGIGRAAVDDENWRAAFDGPIGGENFLCWVAVKATNTGAEQAEAKIEARLVRGQSQRLDESAWLLGAGRSAEAVLRIPFATLENSHLLESLDAKTWLERTVEYWKGLMAGGATIEVPCRKATEALLAAHVCQLIAADHGDLHGGEGFYDEFYIRDGGYQIMELEEAGLWDASAKAIRSYRRAQRADGRFESQSNQYDANGQALWTLWQYYKITGDRDWLAEVYPQMLASVEWIKKARREAPADSPFAGVLPAAPADGEFLWDGKHHIVGYDLWNLRGVLCAADVAAILGKDDEAAALRQEADEYRAAIDAVWERTGVAHFPPSWEKAGTHWGNTETLWPTEIFPVDEPRVSALIDHARHVHGGGFIEGTIQWLGGSAAIHPYMSAYTTMASLRRGEHEQVVEDFYWYLLHSTAAHAFPEGIFPKRRFAWSHTIPHVTGASNYALMLRHMLIDERGDELHLLSAVPDGWLAAGEEIRVENVPTHFGPLSLVVRGTAEGVEIRYDPPARQSPQRTVLYLPGSRPLVTKLEGVEIAARSEQTIRWDFATVVERYKAEAGAAMKPIPDLVALPAEGAIAAGNGRMLDLSTVANTDPFTAPFGVPNPGKLLFTGMPVGEQTIGGVPFRILDPARNDGRAFVVLHSPRAPKDRTWPSEVEIPVGASGKRLYFLGNIHGWGPADEGTGEWGAVAEYVIHYADGQTQTVPLVTGRTIDEWTASPEAEEVFVGLQGDPWHLNVLGVAVRDAVIKSITFRDLGTPAAPVLVSVTLEE